MNHVRRNGPATQFLRRTAGLDTLHTRWYIYTAVAISAFQMLADPNRMQIVQLLLDSERAVNDLVGRMAIQQSGVSRHLRILEQAGFVQTRAVGTKRMYSLRPERFQELDQWLSQYRQLWSARLDAFGYALETKQKRRAQKRRRNRK